MNFNLTMVNLWIGLCRGVTGLPTVIRELGYTDRSIDWPFSNQDGEQVVPDLIIASDNEGHTALLECKSGANTEEDQLHRYSRVTRADLELKAMVGGPATALHDIAIVGKSEHAARLQIGITTSGHSFPLISATDTGMSLTTGSFQVTGLTKALTPELPIDWGAVPTSFVPIDQDSLLWEVAEIVIPQLLAAMAVRSPVVRPIDLAGEVCKTWSMMGTPARNQIVARISEILERAATSEFKEFLAWNRQQRTLRIKANPLDFGADKQSAAYKRLLAAQGDFLKRLRGQPDPADQLKMFDSI